MASIEYFLNKVPGIRVQNDGRINIAFKNIVESKSAVDTSAELDNPLGIHYQPWEEDFVILLSNRTSNDIRHVFLHIMLSTLDERHKWYARRPLYRADAESKESGLTDYLKSDEREIAFHVNTTGTLANDRRGNWKEEHNGNLLIDWIQKNQRNRNKLYMMTFIGYEFFDGKERRQRIDRFVEIPMRGVTWGPENGVRARIERVIGENGISQNEYEAITGFRGPTFLKFEEYFAERRY